MLGIFSFDDNKKIGMLLLLVAGALYFFGVLMLFARSMLLLSNLLFLFGLYFFVGVNGILKFFTKKGKKKGSIVYFVGLMLIVVGLSFFGAVLQGVGFFFIFRSFLPQFYDYICKTPLIGSYLKSYWLQNFLDQVSGNQVGRI